MAQLRGRHRTWEGRWGWHQVLQAKKGAVSELALSRGLPHTVLLYTSGQVMTQGVDDKIPPVVSVYIRSHSRCCIPIMNTFFQHSPLCVE
jgi:hypothetical protein